jgi:hypothetical protein
MTLATQIVDQLEAFQPEAFSLYGGYAIKAGAYSYIKQGIQTLEKRNDKGRVIKARYQYADDSIIEYTYRPTTQTYTLVAKHANWG